MKNWATYCAFQITETTENLQKCVRETEFYVMKSITFCKKQGLSTAHFNLMRLKSVFLPHLRVPICGRCYTNIILWTNAFRDIFSRVWEFFLTFFLTSWETFGLTFCLTICLTFCPTLCLTVDLLFLHNYEVSWSKAVWFNITGNLN